MKRYVALLRGINISGKNKIAMSELKAGFAELGYTAVSIYLNSGNVVFCADIDDKERLSNEIRSMINKRFVVGHSRFCCFAGRVGRHIEKYYQNGGETATRRSMIILFLCFRTYLMTVFIMKLEIQKKSTKKSIIIKM